MLKNARTFGHNFPIKYYIFSLDGIHMLNLCVCIYVKELVKEKRMGTLVDAELRRIREEIRS